MNTFETSMRRIRTRCGKAFPPALGLLLAKANTCVQDTFFGGVRRSLNETVEIKLSARLRVVSEVYEPLAFAILQRILRPGHVAVDVGANIGLYTLSMAKMVYPHGKVLSFEPASESYTALVEHIHRNHLTKVVEPFMLAVGDESGECCFVEEGVLGTNRVGGSSQHSNKAKRLIKKVTTLDEMFERAGSLPDLIKIDVEGYEISVLRGARRTLSRKPCPILCEVHPGYWKTMNLKGDDFTELIADLGYSSFELTGEPSVDFVKMKMVLLQQS